MISLLRRKLRAGKLYTGPAAWCDDYSIVRRPGYYALSPDGKRVRADVPLTCVDDAPGDHLDGACHYEYADYSDYAQRQATVTLEATLQGKAGIGT